MKRVFAVSVFALMSFSIGANAAFMLETSDIEQTDSLTVCGSKANAILMAKAWDKSWEDTDEFIIEHSDDCDSVSLREALPYTVDMSTAQDGIVRVTGFPTKSTLWMPVKQAARDMYARFGQEYGRGESQFDLQMYTPMDGLYTSAAQYGDKVVIQYVYLLAGNVYSFWYDPKTDKVLEMSKLSGSSYNPKTQELFLEQPIINITQRYARSRQMGQMDLELEDKAVVTRNFFPSKTLVREVTGLIDREAPVGSPVALRLLKFTTMA